MTERPLREARGENVCGIDDGARGVISRVDDEAKLSATQQDAIGFLQGGCNRRFDR
jgi:hypothetical protein